MANKVITGVLLCFLAFLLMSHNVSAIDFSVPVTFVKGYGYPYWSDNNGRSYGQGRYDYGTNYDYASSSAQYFRTDNNSALTTTAGQYVSLTGVIILSVTSQSQAVSIQANPRQYFGMVGSSSNVDCPLIDLEETAYQQSQSAGTTWMLRYNITSVCRVKSNTTNNVAMNFSLNGGSTSGVDYLRFVPVYIGVWKAQSGFDDSDIINAINSLSTAIGELGDKLDDVTGAIQEQNDKEEQATENIENQSEPTSETGDNSASTNLIGNISGVFSQIGNIQASSNCYIPANWGNLNLGNINLCTGKENMPWVVNFGAQVFQFVFVIGTGIILVKQVLALYDWSRR